MNIPLLDLCNVYAVRIPGMMEEVQKSVESILPNLPPQLLEEVREHLASIGVETVSDLQYVKSHDLPMLKDIQVRKLIHKWTPGKYVLIFVYSDCFIEILLSISCNIHISSIFHMVASNHGL